MIARVVWVRHFLMSWLGERAVNDLRRLSFDRLVLLPVGWSGGGESEATRQR